MAATPEECVTALDEAVKQFAAVNLEHTGMVTGWVVMLSVAEYDAGGNLIHNCDYTTSPTCDVVRAVGIVKLAGRKLDADTDPGDGE